MITAEAKYCVSDQIEFPVWEQIEDYVEGPVENQVWEQIGYRGALQVKRQVCSEIYRLLFPGPS